ncbi:hypothetical protein, partial [Xanthomonas vasicola]|uniref:hypothetical protein n=1 Tax=Xanthomonas vasicola TaxID=56459 RepID=UPI001F2F7661
MREPLRPVLLHRTRDSGVVDRSGNNRDRSEIARFFIGPGCQQRYLHAVSMAIVCWCLDAAETL